MDKKHWLALLGAMVPVLITMATLFSRNTTLINEHEVRITALEGQDQTLIQEFLKASKSRKRISSRISYIEGSLYPASIVTDDRGPR